MIHAVTAALCLVIAPVRNVRASVWADTPQYRCCGSVGGKQTKKEKTTPGAIRSFQKKPREYQKIKMETALTFCVGSRFKLKRLCELSHPPFVLL